MRTQFWDLMFKTKYHQCFITRYRRRLNTIKAWGTGIPTVFTFLCITGWSIAPDLSLLWGILIAAAQLLQIVSQQVPYLAHIPALDYFLVEVSTFFAEVEKAWNNNSETGDEAIRSLINDLRDRFQSMDSLYLIKLDMPSCQKMRTIAYYESEQYFHAYFEDDE